MDKMKTYIKACADAFQHTEYPLADRALSMTFDAYPENKSIDVILIKVTLLNELYRTQIFDIFKMSDHVLSIKLDKYLDYGSYEAIDRLRTGHGFKTKTKKQRDFYSFATKYCHWHKPNEYPMYDKYVAVALKTLNHKVRFSSDFSCGDLRDYLTFKGNIDRCKSILEIDWPGYKRFDQALWIYGQIIEGEADDAVKQFLKKFQGQ